MKPREKIQHWIDRILIEKEKMDCVHVREKAKYGCACRRCKAARSVSKSIVREALVTPTGGN